MEFLKNFTEKVADGVIAVGDMTKVYAEIQKEKKKIKASEDKINLLCREIGEMVFTDRNKESVVLDVNYQIKINLILREKEKIKDIEKAIDSKLLELKR